MKTFLPVLLLLPFLSIAQQKGFVINGVLSGAKERSGVFLTDANNPKDTIARSAVVKGKFTLKGKVPEPGLYNLNISEPQKKGLLFLDNSIVSVSGKVDEIQKIKVEGSQSHKDYEDLQKKFNPLFSKLKEVGDQMRLIGATDSFAAVAEKATKDIQTEVDKFLKERKGSYVTPFLLLVTAQLSDDVRLLESRYTGLTQDVQKSYYGKFLKEMVDNSKVGAVGTAAVDFTQNDPDGKPVSLSSFKGKYVLVDFWASWCVPCRQENPNVVNTYQAFKDKNFTVLGVSLDRNHDSWLKAIKDDNLTWTHVSDLKYWNNEVAQKYKVQQIPQNFLIDPDGKIIARNLRGAELSEHLAGLLK